MNTDIHSKDAFVAACEANADAAKWARNANDLEFFRAACATAGDCFRYAQSVYHSNGDPEREERVDKALDELEAACRAFAVSRGERNAA